MISPTGVEHEEVGVVGFQVPRSPDSSYNNPFPTVDEEARGPPLMSPHLQQHSPLSYPPSRDGLNCLPSPQSVTLNHIYIESRKSPRSVVAVGLTHRFRSKVCHRGTVQAGPERVILGGCCISSFLT